MRWLVIGHRWLAILTCVLFAAWFASGLVMMYVGFPALTPAERLAGLEPIDWRAVRIAPERALELAGQQTFPRELRLEMAAGVPVWRIRPWAGPPLAFAAHEERAFAAVTASQALAIARAFAHPARVRFIETLQSDQWSVAGSFDAHRPLHRIGVENSAGTELYVSSRTGEVVLDTTRRERFWNWPGAVLHWLYFAGLRADAALWRQVILWTAGAGILVAASGLWLGIARVRLRRRYPAGRITPWRGWMAWHHVAGLLGGLFTLTWVFSGWLSVDPPVPWAREADASRIAAGLAAYAGNEAPRFAAGLPQRLAAAGPDARQAQLMWLGGRPQIVLTDARGDTRVLAGHGGTPLAPAGEELRAAAARLMPGARLLALARLEREDAYWYGRREPVQLPVLRAIFDDPDATWIHIDPATGRVLGHLDAGDRVRRWLFDALHTFDFRWLRAQPLLRELLVWSLSLVGLVLAVSGSVIGWRHLRRQRKRLMSGASAPYSAR